MTDRWARTWGLPLVTGGAVEAKLCRRDCCDRPDVAIQLLANLEEAFPQWILLILDAKYVKGTWSVRQDAPVFLVLNSDPITVQQAFLDRGVAAHREVSRQFVAGGPESLEDLVAKFRRRHLRSRGFSLGRPIRRLAPNREADAGRK